MKATLLVPAFNEAENVEPLVREFEEFLRFEDREWELVIVDDGSTDGTFERAEALARKNDRVKAVRHSVNLGKTQALITGASEAEGDAYVIFDADLQFTFQDASKLVQKVEEGYDLVAGRKVGTYEKKFVSSIYNFLSRRLFRVPVQDMNAMKAMRKEVFEGVNLRRDWHRYIVVLAHQEGYRVTEEDVVLRPRLHGTPKYSGLFRVFIGFLDLLAVKFQLSVIRKPLLFFGLLGSLSIFGGVLVGGAALYLRFARNEGFRPLLYLVILLVVSGLILFTVGLLGEMVAGLHDDLERMNRRRG
jgi:glycosyltransferase involved in cell wall biosynthesis